MPKASQDFEKNFADLAYSYINNNAPRLLDHMVGFQVLDNNEDESKAVGVFGFAVGGKKKEMFYAPVFFINGKMRGQELLYNAQSDMFIPMEEPWVDFIMNKKPVTIGHGSGDTRGYLGRYLPNFRDMLGRGLNKTASAAEVDPDAVPEFFGHTVLGQRFDITPALGMFMKKAGVQTDLAASVKEDFPLLHAMAVQMQRYDGFTKMACSFYDVTDFVPESTSDIKEISNAIKQEKQASDKHPKHIKQARVVSGDDVFGLELDPDGKRDYIKSGFVVVDDREPGDQNVVVDGEVAFEPPSGPGYYDVVFADKSIRTCLVLRVESCGRSFLVYDNDKRVFWTQDELCTLTGSPNKSLEIGKGGIEPLASRKIMGEDGWKEAYLVSPSGDAFRLNESDIIVESDNVRSVVRDSRGFVTPKGECGMIVLSGRNYELTRDEPEPMRAEKLSLFDVFNSAIIKAASAGGSHVTFEGRGKRVCTSSRLEAMEHLVNDLQLCKDAAEHVLSHVVEEEGPYEFVIKRAAADWIEDYDPEAPDVSLEDIYSGTDPNNGALLTEDISRDEPATGLPLNSTGDYGELDPDVYGTMERAVATKQKDVFDVSAIASLLKITDIGNLVDKYLPDIVTAVDRFGRNLFMLYHNMDEFEERYGKEDLMDLEDTLKSAFSTVGKLVLFLKKRSISSDVDDHDVTL